MEPRSASRSSPLSRGRVLPRRFYQRDARVVAPDLLNKVLISGSILARIVEVEAYCGSSDPASHAYRGKTRRNATMFGPPGHLYVYFTYGMHWCANVVCMPAGVASAVLLRGAEPLEGLEEMWERRPRARRENDLCSGPAKLAQALGLTGADDGIGLLGRSGRMCIVDDGLPPPSMPGNGVRIGIREGSDLMWRWWVPGSRHVSKR